MRLVDIHLAADRPLDVRLDRRLTLVVADDVARERLVSVLRSAFVLAGTELLGTLDAGEYLTPLDPTAVVALDLPGDGLPVLGPDRLPAVDHHRAEERRDAAEARRAALAAALEQAEADAAASARRAALAATAVVVGTGELAAAEVRRDELVAALGALDGRPAVLAAEVGAVTAELEALAGRVADLAALAADVAATRPDPGRPPDAAALGALVPRARSLAAAPVEVLDAVESWCASVVAGDAPPDDRAVALADRAVALDRAWAEAVAQGVEGDPAVVAAREARAEATGELAELESAAADGLLGDRARREVEEAHAAVATAGGNRHLDEVDARRAEAVALARWGFDSYLDYTIAVSTRSAREVAEDRLAAVRAAVEAAGRALDSARSDAAARRERLAAEREELLVEVVALLGHRPEGPVADALAALPGVPAEVDGLAAAVLGAREEAEAGRIRAADEVEELRAEEAGRPEERRRLEAGLEAAADRVASVAALVHRAELAAAAERSAAVDAAAARDGVASELGAADEDRRRAELAVDGLGAEELRTLADDLAALVAGSGPLVPVVLHDTLGPVGADAAAVVLGHLAGAGGDELPQVVYVTGDRRLADWARMADVPLVELRRQGWLRRHVARRAHA